MVAPSAPSYPHDHDHEIDENTKLRLAELFETIFKHFRTVQATIVLAHKLDKPTAGKSARNRQLLDKALLAFGNENQELVSNYLLSSLSQNKLSIFVASPTRLSQIPVDDTLHILAQKLIDESPIRRVAPLAQKLQARTVHDVLNGAAWHTGKVVGMRFNPNAANLHALASRLLKEGKVFAIERAGVKEYPDYAFDPMGNPVPEMSQVLNIMSGYSPFRLASWFESTNAYLGGQRPREVLGTHPEEVVSAARAHVLGPVHG